MKKYYVVMVMLLMMCLSSVVHADYVVDSDTTLLLQFENGYIDSSSYAHSSNVSGGVSISSAFAKYGTNSAYFDGTGKIQISPVGSELDMGTELFTLDWHFQDDGSSATYPAMMSNNLGWESGCFSVGYNFGGNSNKVVLSMFQGAIVSSTVSSGAPHHAALVRVSSTELKLFVDGVSQGSLAVDAGFSINLAAGGSFVIGQQIRDGVSGYYRGYQDAIRVTKGVARWTSDFDVNSISNVPSQVSFVSQPVNCLVNETQSVSCQLKNAGGVNVSVSGVSVDLVMTQGTGLMLGTLSQLTNSSGVATFTDISFDTAGQKVMTASSDGLTSAVSDSLTVSNQPTPTPSPTSTPSGTPSLSGVIYGRVLDKNMQPFSGVKVLYASDFEYSGKNPVVTDVDGYYFFVDADTAYPSVLTMSLQRYGTITKSVSALTSAQVNKLSDEVLVKGNSSKFSLSGTVNDAFASPVDFVRVTARSGGIAYIDFTDTSGGYSLDSLPVGTYTVTIKRDGYYTGRYKISNTDAQNSVLDMVIIDKAIDHYAK